jgi:hypothetical protein
MLPRFINTPKHLIERPAIKLALWIFDFASATALRVGLVFSLSFERRPPRGLHEEDKGLAGRVGVSLPYPSDRARICNTPVHSRCRTS